MCCVYIVIIPFFGNRKLPVCVFDIALRLHAVS